MKVKSKKKLICRVSGFFGVLEERGDSARDRKKVETYVGGIILRFLQIIACNGIEIMETNLLHNVQVYFRFYFVLLSRLKKTRKK